MIKAFTQWFIDLVVRVYTALWDFVSDAVINLLDLVINGLGALVGAIPAPSFLSQYSLGSLINQMPDYVLYFASHFQIGTAMGILAAGFVFRMGRKVVTLGQW